MKKYFHYLIALVIVLTTFSLVSCSNDDEPKDDSNEDTTAQIISLNMHDFYAGVTKEERNSSVFRIEYNTDYINGEYVQTEQAAFWIKLYEKK